jgi:hypothetical protein
MTSSSPKLTVSVAGGMSVLVLQAMTAPFAVVGLVGRTDASSRWLTGLYIALELAAIASVALVVLGWRTNRSAARRAPAALLLPSWLAVAAAGPIAYHGLPIILFSGFALAMGAMTSFPLLGPAGEQLFRMDCPAPAAATLKVVRNL